MPMEDNSSRPGPSIDTGVTNCSPSFANRMNINIVSLEVIRPYPKAQPRKLTTKGRPKKKSCILTSTKLQVEEEKDEKKKNHYTEKENL